jgi:hypothetical protein
MGLAFGNAGFQNLYAGSASPRQLQRLLKARIALMMTNVLGGAAGAASLLGDPSAAAESDTEAVERMARVVSVEEARLEKLYEEQLRALMSGQLEPGGGGGGGGGLFGGLGGGGGGGFKGDGGGVMDEKALKELVPALAQLQQLVDAGQIDDQMLRELRTQLTSQGASLAQLVQVRGRDRAGLPARPPARAGARVVAARTRVCSRARARPSVNPSVRPSVHRSAHARDSSAGDGSARRGRRRRAAAARRDEDGGDAHDFQKARPDAAQDGEALGAAASAAPSQKPSFPLRHPRSVTRARTHTHTHTHVT